MKLTLSFMPLDGNPLSSLTATKEHVLKMFKNRVLKRKFGPKREKVTGD
jgi:hypothetical protein